MAVPTSGQAPAIPPDRVDAVIFDVDGVITDTADIHFRAWKDIFDAELRRRAEAAGEDFAPFSQRDYLEHVDGRPRYDGVRAFLTARGIELPEGTPDDPPELETVCGIGNRKNRRYQELLANGEVVPYPATVALIDTLRRAGLRTAAISASRNATRVLDAANVLERFDVVVDGVAAAERGLAGKPDPAIFLEAAAQLGVAPDRAVVVEDARSGVDAGRRGGFGLVVGVDRGGQRQALLDSGADLVVDDLDEIRVLAAGDPAETDPAERDPAEGDPDPPIRDLPDALDHLDDLLARLSAGETVVFLDYDGTLTPIVEDPAAATLSAEGREAVAELARDCTVAIVSGRDLDDVRDMVGVDGIHYAGSHGFDLLAPDGERTQQGTEYLDALDAAEEDLAPAMADIPGARLERKRFAIAVHTRQVDDQRVPDVEAAVDAVVAARARLRKTGGKRIFELRPDLDWDKGRALHWLLTATGLDRPDVVPVYVGDDLTDEDAFAAIHDRGVGVVVSGEDDDRGSKAHYSLGHPDDVVRFLQALRAASEERA